MANSKLICETIKGFFKGIFDSDITKKTTGCCGGGIPKALIDKNTENKEGDNA